MCLVARVCTLFITIRIHVIEFAFIDIPQEYQIRQKPLFILLDPYAFTVEIVLSESLHFGVGAMWYLVIEIHGIKKNKKRKKGSIVTVFKISHKMRVKLNIEQWK